jgi:dimethylamine--corrinoid protein Co-methyltransferase
VLGTEATHAIAAGMGGVRTAGDLVLRVQLAKKLRIKEAKQYVANKLGLTTLEICDITTMSEVREDRGFGLPHFEPYAESNIGMEAKFRLAKVLDIKINSVERFMERAGIK